MKRPQCYTREVLKKVLPKFCKGKVVDVGSGRGKYKDLITKYCSSFTAVDNMSSDFQFGQGSSSPDVISDVASMPFQDGNFDTVICTEVLEHVEDPFKLMKEISRILKPGGYAIFSSAWAAPYHKEPKDYWRFSLDGYEVLCRNSGLEIKEVHKQGGFFSLLLYFINRSVDLNTKKLKKVKAFLGRINIIFEKIAEKMDKFHKTDDAIGHLIVARKL